MRLDHLLSKELLIVGAHHQVDVLATSTQLTTDYSNPRPTRPSKVLFPPTVSQPKVRILLFRFEGATRPRHCDRKVAVFARGPLLGFPGIDTSCRAARRRRAP